MINFTFKRFYKSKPKYMQYVFLKNNIFVCRSSVGIDSNVELVTTYNCVTKGRRSYWS